MPVEAGCSGFLSYLNKAYGTMGITGSSRRRAISSNIETAERASRLFWLKRGEM